MDSEDRGLCSPAADGTLVKLSFKPADADSNDDVRM